jgi:hypothetical protein
VRFFLDSEFAEDGRVIDLISIALVADDGREYYAVATDGWSPESCNDFVKANVLPKLPPRDSGAWKPRAQIAAEIRDLLLAEGKPEVWGYFSDYDWVVLCQLYGRMVDLPEGFPFWCRDLKQLMWSRGFEKSEIPVENKNEHDAIADARWIRYAWAWIAAQPSRGDVSWR